MSVQTITYTNKAQLYANSDIADINKVKATDMNEIKTVVNNNASELGTIQTLVNNETLISSTEKVIGKYDNETLYGRYLTISTLPNNTNTLYDTGISNINRMIRLTGTAWGTTGNAFPLPFVGQTQTANIELVYIAGSNQIRITTGENRSTMNAKIYMEYTKTS